MSTLRLVPVSGQPIDVIKEQSTVGRDPSCEVVVTDGSVSRRHARLELRGGSWWIVDQGSANGTYINSLRVAEQELKNGQELRFGALAFRVDLVADPEATVATPVLQDESATIMAPGTPPPMPSGPPPAAAPAAPAPLPAASPTAPAPALRPAGPPPIPRPGSAAPPMPSAPPAPRASSAAAKVPPAGPHASPVRPLAAGPAAAKKGRSPIFWVILGCCGCLLLVGLLAGVIGGGVFMATKGAADAGHAWLGAARQSQSEAVINGLSSDYRNRLSNEELETITATVRSSSDASFMKRSIENDRALLVGTLTGGGGTRPITLRLVKEGGAWKVDDVNFSGE